jgi:IclR family pca regulon transcriptional regulator
MIADVQPVASAVAGGMNYFSSAQTQKAQLMKAGKTDMSKDSQADSAENGNDTDALPKPGDSYVQSFARGLAVLRSFGAAAPAQTLSEVAERTGLTRAGARRILLTLLHLGYVSADGRLFRLTPKVLELGFAYLSSLPVWSQAQPLMEELAQRLRQSCSAAVLDGEEIVYVARLAAHKTMSINLGVGSRLPAHCTAMGRVLLSGLEPAQLADRLRSMALPALTPNTVVDPDGLAGVIAAVRRQGWCMVLEELELGLISIAAPIYDHSGRIVAALNISSQLTTTTRAEMLEHSLPALLGTAESISKLRGQYGNMDAAKR